MLKIKMFVETHKINELEERMNEWLEFTSDSICVENIKITTSSNSTIVLVLYNIV